MKTPAELARKWQQQWESADYREQRLLNPESWPISLPIGRPTPADFVNHTGRLREHVERWRAVRVGRVHFESLRFRAGSESVELPVEWELRRPSEWAQATNNLSMQREYERLGRLIAATDPLFHRILIRQRSLTADKSESEVIHAGRVAMALNPGCADGRPLRALSIAGTDSKFFERHRNLIVQFLDARFAEEVSDQGLEAFLGALDERDHWLLIAPLDPGLLPFKQQRIRASELIATSLPGSHVLIVENERCIHQLPCLPQTVAILGAGLNLEWMQADWLQIKQIGYWGDIDTWGLQMLARARQLRPELTALLMTQQIFESQRLTLAVCEPTPADEEPPSALDETEKALYRYLCEAEKGRLEQEFLPQATVSTALKAWREGSTEAKLRD
jgi:hypothetical protein